MLHCFLFNEDIISELFYKTSYITHILNIPKMKIILPNFLEKFLGLILLNYFLSYCYFDNMFIVSMGKVIK